MKTALVFTLLAAVILLSAGASAPLTLTAVDKKSSANSVAELSNSEIDTSVHYKKKKKRCRTYCVKYKKKYCKKCRYKKKCKKVNKCVRYCKNKYGYVWRLASSVYSALMI